MLAAAMLRRIGFPPLLLNMFPEPGTDDEHLLAVFRQHGVWGAVAKSNLVGLRFREPVYRTLRELVMSYFEPYYNVARKKTLRSYTRPLDLSAFDCHGVAVVQRAMDADRTAARRPAANRVVEPHGHGGRIRRSTSGLTKPACRGSDPAGLFVPSGSTATQ